MVMCYTPLSRPTRLAAGLGLKELPYPFRKEFAPKNWFPRFTICELSLYNFKIKTPIVSLFYYMQYSLSNKNLDVTGTPK
ncbi:hypothetical protein Clst_2253 [Thermoclostridium stercorarium subsp. stercorarium DSM 8532]|jgi:hypothetical protein|nr:hypothetical protein Clst_2253 [Thermoclostridium stercorarium subsp. stercorarium DSM 8532]